jgi:hypothetical protein
MKNDDERKRLSSETSEKRKKAFRWMDGWVAGAAMKSVTESDWNDEDFLAGWRKGNSARATAHRQAEEVTGYLFAKIQLAANSVKKPEPMKLTPEMIERLRAASERGKAQPKPQ